MKTISKLYGRFLLLVRLLALGFFLLIITRLAAQDLTGEERFGRVFLKSGEQVEGLVQPNLDHNYLLVKLPDGTRAYNAWQVEAYILFDPFAGRFLTYYSLPYQHRGKKADTFFELVQEGTLTLLNREADRVQDNPAAQVFPAMGYVGPAAWQRAKTEAFYVLGPADEVTRYYGGRKELLKMMPDHAEQVNHYIARHKLNLTEREDLKLVFSYYDALQRGAAEGEDKGSLLTDQASAQEVDYWYDQAGEERPGAASRRLYPLF
jgi:hypothetical protein